MNEAQKKEFTEISIEVIRECVRSRQIHGKFPTAHHGLAVAEEEFDEMRREVFKKQPDKAKLRNEAIQLAAAAFHMITDICGD